MQVTRYGGGLKSGGHCVLCTSVKQRVVDIVFCVQVSNKEWLGTSCFVYKRQTWDNLRWV